jgi:hypothetical protein
VLYNPNNEAKGERGENLVNHTFTSNGYTVKCHNVYDGGCDGIFYGNGVKLGCYEVNYWLPNTYFNDERIEGIDCNLYNGFEWLNGNFIRHKDIKYKFHICIGAIRNQAQIDEAKELGIIYIHIDNLPTEEELWNLIKPYLEGNPNLKYYKVVCIANSHLDNDRTSMMVLVTPTIHSIFNIILVLMYKISSKTRLKGILLCVNSFLRARFSKPYFKPMAET